MMFLQSSSRGTPERCISVCLILAISYTCFKDIVPIVSWPGLLAPFSFPFCPAGSTAFFNSQDVWGVRTSKWNDRSGRTVIRVGIGVPWIMCDVLALNSCKVIRKSRPRDGQVAGNEPRTLQKSIDLTPLLPSAGPTGGLGLA